MKNESPVLRLRAWLNNIPIRDPIERRIATLLQVVLIGLMVVVVLATLFLVALPALSFQEKLNAALNDLFGFLVVALPLILLRRGYFRGSALIIIAILFITPTLAVLVVFDLLNSGGILFQFTLAILLAGLLVSRRALALTFVLSAAVVGFAALRGQNAAPQLTRASLETAANFILFNGLIALFFDRFGIVLRAALKTALERESDLKNEINERRHAEILLQESEARYRQIVEKASDIIYRTDESGRFTYVNQIGLRLMGFDAETDVLGRRFLELVRSDWRHALKRFYDRQFLAQTENTYQEFPALTTDGAIVWLGQNVQLLREGERVLGFQAVARDITKRRQAQKALEEANLELRAAKNEIEHSLFEVEERKQELTVLSNLSELLQMSNSVTEAGEAISRAIPVLFPHYGGTLYVINSSHDLAESIAVWGDSLHNPASFAINDCWALRRGDMHITDFGHTNPLCTHGNYHPRDASLCAPLSAQGETLGILHILGRHEANSASINISKTQELLARTVSDHIALGLSNILLREKLHNQSIRDPLTGLFNRRYMEETLEREVRRANRMGASLGIIIVDIDHFKLFNDTFSHGAGDALLRELGAFLALSIRGEDVACRYGGEEFALILPGLDLEMMKARAELLREGAKHLRVHYRGELLDKVTLSLGVAIYPEHGDTGENVLHEADAALYRAKREGRDRVVAAG